MLFDFQHPLLLRHSKPLSPANCSPFLSAKDYQVTAIVDSHNSVQTVICGPSSHTPGWAHSITMEENIWSQYHNSSEVFDRVCHGGPFAKMYTLLFSPCLLFWTSSFLSKQNISVRVNWFNPIRFSLTSTSCKITDSSDPLSSVY